MEEAIYRVVGKLQECMEQLVTAPYLMEEIIPYYRGKGETYFEDIYLTLRFYKDFSVQDVIGCQYFMEGNFAQVFSKYQSGYYHSISSKHSTDS